MILLAAALAHPVGGHRVDHVLEWRIGPEGSEVVYTVDVPHQLASPSVEAELATGLVLSRDGHTVPLVVTQAKSRAIQDATRVTLHLASQHAPGALRLSNGNLPDATSRTLARVEVHRDVAWIDGPAEVEPLSERARVLAVDTAPAGWVQRMERRARDGSPWRTLPAEPLVPIVVPGVVLAGLLALGLAVRRFSR